MLIIWSENLYFLALSKSNDWQATSRCTAFWRNFPAYQSSKCRRDGGNYKETNCQKWSSKFYHKIKWGLPSFECTIDHIDMDPKQATPATKTTTTEDIWNNSTSLCGFKVAKESPIWSRKVCEGPKGMLCILDLCDPGWWGCQLNTNWWGQYNCHISQLQYIPGNVTLLVAPPGGQITRNASGATWRAICFQCKGRHLVAKFVTDASGAVWRSSL